MIPVPTDMKPGEERTFLPDYPTTNPPLIIQMFEHNLDEGWTINFTDDEVQVTQPLGIASKPNAGVTIRYIGCFLEDYARPDGDPRLIERAERMVYDYRADRLAAIRAARPTATARPTISLEVLDALCADAVDRHDRWDAALRSGRIQNEGR